jgi:ABC-type amino acid transport substrate-binding protein
VLRVGADLTYPPYDYQQGGTPAGFDPEIMRGLASRLHQQVVFQDTRFAQLIPSLNSGQFGVIASALYITAKRATQVDYIPYLETGNSILVRAGTPGTAVGVSYLCGKTVGVIAGGAVVQSLQSEANGACKGSKPIQVHEFPTDPEATQALLSQQVDAQVTDAAVAKAAVDKLAGKIELASAELLYPIPVGLAVKKGNNALAQQLKKGLDELRASGRYQALLERYNLRAPDMAQVAKILGS